jgi:hypothetical protein
LVISVAIEPGASFRLSATSGLNGSTGCLFPKLMLAAGLACEHNVTAAAIAAQLTSATNKTASLDSPAHCLLVTPGGLPAEGVCCGGGLFDLLKDNPRLSAPPRQSHRLRLTSVTLATKR